MCIHKICCVRFAYICVGLAYVLSLDFNGLSNNRHVYAMTLSPMWPMCKVSDGPVRYQHGKKVTWVSCECKGTGICTMDVDRLLNAASLFSRHYNVINVTCSTKDMELVWTNNKPVDVIQDFVIKDCKLAKNSTLFAAKSPLEELWLDNLGNEISKPIFEGIEDLESLIITKHKHNIVMDFLPELPYLKSLTINEAGLVSIPVQLIDHSLQYLDFNNNSISHEGLPDITSTDHRYVMEDLYLDRNQIKDLSNYSFNGRVKYLSLTKNGLHSISNETFTNLKILRELNIGGNELVTLPLGVFSDLYYVNSIDVSNNKLTSLPLSFLTGLQSLKYINMGNNELSELSNGVFTSDLTNLMTIQLHNNEFESIPDQVLRLPGVNSIDFSQNKIQVKDIRELFINPENPFRDIVVNLANNNISNLPVNWSNETEVHSLQQMMKSVYYELEGNNFNCDCNAYGLYNFINLVQNQTMGVLYAEKYKDSIKCGGPAPLKGQNLYSVSVADLKCPLQDNCPTHCNCYKFFNSEGQVTSVVNCTRADIKMLPQSLPVGTSKFYVDHNKLTVLEHRSYLSKLNIFSATHNNITFINENFTDALNNVQSLSLEYNNISYLPESFSNLNLSYISLHHNPLICDCHTVWMKTWITHQQNSFGHLAQTCCTVPPDDSQPNNHTSIPIIALGQAEFVCTTPQATVSRVIARSDISIIVVVLMVILAIVMSTACGVVVSHKRRLQRNYNVASCNHCPSKTVQCIKSQASCASVCNQDDMADDIQPLTIV